MHIVSLFEVCRPKQWKTIASKDLIASGYPVYGANGKIGFHSDYNHEEPTLLITCRGATCGSVLITEPQSYVNGNAMSLDNLNTEKVHINYLYYYLKHRGFNDVISGSAQPQITRQGLSKVKVPLPSIEVQKCIVSLLDQADALRCKRKESIKLLDQYVQAVFIEMFENNAYDWRSLAEATNFIDYRGKTPEKTEKGVKLITAKNVKDGYLSEEPQEFIAEDNYIPWMRRGFPKPGDVLFTTEAPLGNTAILPYFDKVAFAQRIIIIQPKEDLTPEFLLFALSSLRVRRDIQQKSTGSTVKGIRSKELKKVLIPIPPLKQQQKFSMIQKSAISIKIQMANQQYELEQQFNALMQRAFSGSL